MVATFYLVEIGSHWGLQEKIAKAVASTQMKALNTPKPGGILSVASNTKLASAGCELSVATYIIGDDEVVSIGYLKHDAVFLAAVESETGTELEFRIPTNVKPGKWKLLVRGTYTCNPLQRLFPTTFSLPLLPFEVKAPS
jgi:hypothetical protein